MLRQFRAQILERFLSMRLNGVRTAQIFRHKWAKESLNRAINICTPGLRSILYVSSQEIAALSKGASHDDRHVHRISLTRLACHAPSRCDDRCLDQDAACRLGSNNRHGEVTAECPPYTSAVDIWKRHRRVAIANNSHSSGLNSARAGSRKQ